MPPATSATSPSRRSSRPGVPAGEIVAGGRNLAAARPTSPTAGSPCAPLDYSDPASLTAALAGAEKVLIVSGTDVGQRVAQHTAVARAALAAGATQLVYTSGPYATTTSMLLGAEHAGTELALEALGAPLTVLRNGWYLENYTAQLPLYLEHGAVVGAAHDGRISAAARADYADAAAAVLTGDGHVGAVYELGGDTSFTLAELAADGVASDRAGGQLRRGHGAGAPPDPHRRRRARAGGRGAGRRRPGHRRGRPAGRLRRPVPA